MRDTYENLLTHAGDRTRDIFSVQGDQTTARRLQFLRNHAEMEIHRGKQHMPAPRQAFRYQPSQIFRHNDLSYSSKESLKDTVFLYLPPRDPILLIQEPENHTSASTWRALPVEVSEAHARAQSSTMVSVILWIGLNARGKQQFMATGCVSVKGPANLSAEDSIQSTHSDDCFFHATADRNTAVRYAYGAHGNGSGSVSQICVPAVVSSYGAEAVRLVNRKNKLADLNNAEDSRAAFFARKDFETLLLVPNLSTVNGHILAHLDVADLNLG